MIKKTLYVHDFMHIQRFYMFDKIHTLIADDRFVFGVRLSSICSIIDATERRWRVAILCNASMNSGSSDILGW